MLELQDVKSVCPPLLVKDSGKSEMPWLTDNVRRNIFLKVSLFMYNII